nr:hypothetical protein [Colletotrichum associated partitivirus 2]
MDSYPTRDFLTVNENPPQLKVRTATKIAFATLCSPTTYGVLLHKELASKNKEHEYLAIRNAAILRRECLKTDILNPIISQRARYLGELTKLTRKLDSLTEMELIATQYCDFVAETARHSAIALNNSILGCVSVDDYLDRNGPRLSLALSFNSSTQATAKLLSDYEAKIRQLASQLTRSQPIFKFLLLDEGYLSCLVVLSNNDLETQFLPVLLDRERSLLKACLTQLGEEPQPTSPSQEILDLFNRLWRSKITIDRHKDTDFFTFDKLNEFDHFRIINVNNNVTENISANKQPKLQTSLMNLMRSGATTPSPNSIVRSSTPFITESDSADIGKQVSFDGKCNSTELLPNSNATSVSNELSSTNTAQTAVPLRLNRPELPTPFEERKSFTIDKQKARELARHIGLVVQFANVTYNIKFIRSIASQSPDKQRPGDVVHVRVYPRGPPAALPANIYIKRFTVSDTNQVSLFMTRQKEFQTLLELSEWAARVEVVVTRGTLKELVEIDNETANQWFVLSMD